MENCSSLNDITDFGSDFEMESRPTTPPEVIKAACDAKTNLLPKKSNDRYQQAYNSFQAWKSSKGATSNSERTLLAYFNEMKKKFAASSLWSKYSMLKSTMVIYDQIDISTYGSLTAMLKQASKDYVPKQAKTFTEIEMQRFMDTAPDVAWLDVKVVCAFGLSGACRTHEFPTIRMQDIARYDDMFYVTVPRSVTKTRNDNSFAITGALLDYVRKYESLRPGHATSDRFFLNFQKGKCTVQAIGKSKFYKMPRRIAEFLNLPDPENYTGN
ncbi:hypothetical protein HA402_011976 [Bradysia odoriphaga]|nr:hypothetical protein HA402_011976 [Bradysia odoriphaga]